MGSNLYEMVLYSFVNLYKMLLIFKSWLDGLMILKIIENLTVISKWFPKHCVSFFDRFSHSHIYFEGCETLRHLLAEERTINGTWYSSYILRRPQNFAKYPPYICPMKCQSSLRTLEILQNFVACSE